MQNYVAASGLDINSLWHLEDAFDVRPQWTAFAISKVTADDSDNEGPRSRSLVKKPHKEQKVLRLAAEPESDDSMPGLQSVSNSDEEDDEDGSDSEDESDDGDYDSDNEDGYNTDEEDEIRELWREAMEAARDAEYLDGGDNPSEVNPFTEDDRKGNPFLKLLGSLRGESE